MLFITGPYLYYQHHLYCFFVLNYCGGDFHFFFQTADRFSNKDNELQWTACVSLYVRETGRLKDPGGTPYNGLYGNS